MIRILFLALIAAIFINLAPTGALANAERLFTKLDGKFRGSGNSITGSDGKKYRVSCQLTNNYSKSSGKTRSGKLKMTGKCASSQGKSSVRGTISHSGNTITGSYISLRSNVKMIKSLGKADNKSLKISSTFINEANGKRIKIRQILRLTGSGFKANFYTFDNERKKYKSAGAINFKRK
jgi:hypothetical protein